ncbi:hypothetical protein CPB86DRAFT_797412 [Serendipita vermifera]|nr:hypothetical protein CPB86DRAFT_797412 [Serendipita vermifera]
MLGYDSPDQIVADAAPNNLRELLNSSDWVEKNGELAIKAVQLQLDTYYSNVETSIQPAPTPTTPSDIAVHRISALLEEDPQSLYFILGTINPTTARATWSWPNIPYPAICSIWRKAFRDNVMDISTKDEVVNFIPEVDNWVIQNEDWLRQRLHDPKQDWRTGLVSLENCDDIFFSSTSFPSFRQITRNSVDGWKCLDAKRSASISIQISTKSFKEKFEEMTYGQLKGLDWSNVFVAGGIVVGSLLCTKDPSSENTKEQWKSSDIDIYIYGLDPVQANEKIEHLFKVFKNNLPEEEPILVVRNSKTISFISNFPRRRFQIILKIVKNPAEVLLNFDLDICAMGFDEECVYMLPRAARALETGYNVFTMDMVQGHYLGTRRATQEQRVFKYASKGYGIRILPRYLDALKKHQKSSSLNLNIEDIMANARRFSDRYCFFYDKWSHNRDVWKLLATGSDDPSLAASLSRESKRVLSHAQLDTVGQCSSEPLRRSCLTGFELFYRHVCLWEAEQAGQIEIKDNLWASTTYDEALYQVPYDELPCYEWDESFNTEEFRDRISKYNEGFLESLQTDGDIDEDQIEKITALKIIAGSSLEEVMEENLSIPIWIPEDFVNFAREMIKKVSKDMPDIPFNQCFRKLTRISECEDYPETLILVDFSLSAVTMFQQIDRRLDEVFEAVWSFMYSNSIMRSSPEEKTMLLRRQLSRRALRRKPEDEYKDFISWIKRDPGRIAGYNYGGLGQGFWSDVAPQDDSDDEEAEFRRINRPWF